MIVKIHPLIPVGSKITIEKSRIENLFQKELMVNLPQIINCEVIDYKITDGEGIGYILMTENNIKIWIFNSEINEETKKEYKINDTDYSTTLITEKFLSQLNNVEYDMNGNRSIKKIANPINIITWLIFTLKDIF